MNKISCYFSRHLKNSDMIMLKWQQLLTDPSSDCYIVEILSVLWLLHQDSIVYLLQYVRIVSNQPRIVLCSLIANFIFHHWIFFRIQIRFLMSTVFLFTILAHLSMKSLVILGYDTVTLYYQHLYHKHLTFLEEFLKHCYLIYLSTNDAPLL